MPHHTILRRLAALATALALVLPAVPRAAPAAEQDVALTPANAEIHFSVGALGLFSIQGRFARFTGQLRRDPDDASRTQAAVLIDTTSIEAEGPAADSARGRDLLRTRDFPTMTFRSVGLSRDAAGHEQLDGLLTLAGVTRPLSLALRQTASGGLTAEGTLQRGEFGLTGMRPFVSDRVALRVTVAPIP